MFSPADPNLLIGDVVDTTPDEVTFAIDSAKKAFVGWSETAVSRRAEILRRTADLYEENIAEITALATREAGKTLLDGIAEVREAVDFLRYYANEAERLHVEEPGKACGVFVCISPWNFPLAIYSGQIAGGFGGR